MVALAFGCEPGLLPPDDAQITCHTDAECPQGWECVESTQLCIDASRNAPPLASIREIFRSATVVDVPVFLLDSDGDLVSLAMEFAVGIPSGGWIDWQRIDPAEVSPDPTAIPAAMAGGEHTLAWDIVATATRISQGLGLQATTTYSREEGSSNEVPIGVVAYLPEVRLRVVPTDSNGNEGSAAVSEPFAMGNTPPRLTLTEWPGTVVFRNYVPIEFSLADWARDPAVLDVEYATEIIPGNRVWKTATLAFGDNGSQPLVTSEIPELRLVIWDARADLGAGLHTTARIRARAIDNLGGKRSFLSDWSSQAVPDIDND